jgi:His-Xaa-Ser system radical SAM maturase HxsB
MKFQSPEAFNGGPGYRLLPFRFRRLPWDSDRVFVSSLAGDHLIMPRADLDLLVEGHMGADHPLFGSLQARHVIAADPELTTLVPLLSQMRTRKAYIESGPALHIFVVSLRCHHTCNYCQVSRQPTGASHFDMAGEAAGHAVDRLFDWPSRDLTVEFQGGEPLLHFARVRDLIERIDARNQTEGRRIRYVLASTLHDLTDEQLCFMRDHNVVLSTSLDGPEWLHNANRPRPEKDSYRRTLEGIERGRRALGADAVSALTTLTRLSLTAPEAIVDEYRKQGFHTISLRPLSPYGFARKTDARNGYSIANFLAFYGVAFAHLMQVNRSGYRLEETTASLLLSQLLTPFAHGYVDLRSPTGAGLGAVIYDYDGTVYPSDEARMLAAMGDRRFALGRVDEPVDAWLASDAMGELLDAGVAEALPTCADCAYVPYCGADPIDHYARQGDCVGHRPSSSFCERQIGLFDFLIQQLETCSVQEKDLLYSWAHQQGADGVADPIQGELAHA